MRKTSIVLTLVVLTTTLAFAQQTTKQDHKPAEKKMAAANAGPEIAKVREAWIAAYNAKDAAKVASLYSENAVYATMVGVAKGRQQIQAALQKEMDSGTQLLSVSPDGGGASGAMAWEEGSYEGKVNNATQTGRFLVVLKKSGGEWRLESHNAVVPQ